MKMGWKVSRRIRTPMPDIGSNVLDPAYAFGRYCKLFDALPEATQKYVKREYGKLA